MAPLPALPARPAREFLARHRPVRPRHPAVACSTAPALDGDPGAAWPTAFGTLAGARDRHHVGVPRRAQPTRRSCAPSTPSCRSRRCCWRLLIVNLLGKSSFNAVMAIGIAFTPGMTRVTRSVALAVTQAGLCQRRHRRAASAAASSSRREMLPNVVAPIVVEMTIRVAFAVMLFATPELPRSGRAAARLRSGA